MRYCFNLILLLHFLASRKCVVECFEFNIHINLDKNVLSKFSRKFLISNAKASLERETLMCSSWSKADTRNSFSLKTITVFDNPTLIFNAVAVAQSQPLRVSYMDARLFIGAFCGQQPHDRGLYKQTIPPPHSSVPSRSSTEIFGQT